MSPSRKITRLFDSGLPSEADIDPKEARKKADALNLEAEKLLSVDPARARKLAFAAREFAARHDLKEAVAFSRFIEGTAISFATDFDLARQVLEEASQEAEAAGEVELANRCRNGLATIYERMGEYGRSCEMLHHCLALAMVTEDLKAQCRALSNLGNLHLNMSDYDRAISLLEDAHDRAQGVEDTLLMVTIRANLAEALVANGRLAEGFEIGRACQEDALRHGYRLQWGFITAIVAAASMGNGDYKGAARSLESVRQVAEELGERDLLCDTLLKEVELALQHATGLDIDIRLGQALDLAQVVGIRQFQVRAHRMSALRNESLGQFKEAFFHRSRELELSNELKEENVARKVQVLAVEMSVDQHRRRADEEKQRSAELAALNEKLTETLARAEHYASHDSLTELLNRRKFLDLTEESLSRARAEGDLLGLAFVDLDGFKQINDSLGHHAGDALLVEVARRLKLAVRGCDLVARAGGDEFMVLLRERSNREEIAQAVQQIVDVFDAPFSLHGTGRFATGSVGCAVFPDDGDSVTTLRVAADRAMYAEKRRRHIG